MDWTKIVDWIKLSPKYLLPISLFSGALLFIDPNWISFFGLNNFVIQFRPFISIIFFLSDALLLSHFIFQIANPENEWIKNRKKYSRMKKMLVGLTVRRQTLWDIIQYSK